MTDARRGWLKEELEEVHNEVATWPAWKRGETMSQDAQREPMTRYEPCPMCTANRPRLCDLHYQQRAEEFMETVKQAVIDHRTPSGVKATYEELLDINRALADRLATEETERAEAVRRYEASEVRANDLQQRLATIARLTDRIDLQCDEFQRISALTENDEIKGLCARAVKDIRQHVPVIQQRDTAEQQVARLRVFAEFIKDKRRKQWARWADEAEDPVSSDDEIEKLDEQFREACKALRETGAKPSNTA